MKVKRLCVLSLAIGLVSMTTVYAGETDQGEFHYEIKDEASQLGLEDAVQDVIDENTKESIIVSADGTEVGNDLFDVQTVDLENAYHEYVLKDFMIQGYYNTKDFRQIMSDEERIKVPYVTVQGKDAILVYEIKDGKLKLQEEQLLPEDASSYVSPEQISKIVNETVPGTEITDVVYTYSNRYYATLVYVETNQGKYIIPYVTGVVLQDLNIENGTVYTADEFFEQMNKIFDESILKPNSQGIGGLPYRQIPWTRNIILVVAAVGIVIVGGVIVAKRILDKRK